jgi:hypothetical protein
VHVGIDDAFGTMWYFVNMACYEHKLSGKIEWDDKHPTLISVEEAARLGLVRIKVARKVLQSVTLEVVTDKYYLSKEDWQKDANQYQQFVSFVTEPEWEEIS